MASTVNVLLSTFPGLGLPNTICLPLSATSSVSDLSHLLSERLPSVPSPLTLSTNSNRNVDPHSTAHLTSLLHSSHDVILSLRLSVPILGGKGGFGSQLRAAGGRMSSRKKRNQGEANSSSRNLDGRRIRTVAEAKRLAEYLSTKPEIDRKAREERLERQKAIYESTEAKIEEAKSGPRNAKVDGAWDEARSEAIESAELAAKRCYEAGHVKNVLPESGPSPKESESGETSEGSGSAPQAAAPTKVFGWDDGDDEFLSSSDEEDAQPEGHQEDVAYEGKGKGKAMA